jgi:16S rRNA (guanine(1405)-N(7))-methyltransferase
MAIPWMPLPAGVIYYAYDMYADLAAFLNRSFKILGIHGEASACDVVQHMPSLQADLALILKSLPCLEQLDKAAGRRLLESIRAEHLLVSFPVRSLGGKDKRMSRNYEEHLRTIVATESWSVQRFEFATELAFLITK